MSLENATIAVTGSGGFVGHAMCKKLVAAGAAVRSLVRYRSDFPGEFQFDLANSIMNPAALNPPVRAVVHCAWDMKSQDFEESTRINVEGTQWLIERCKQAGVEQFIFVSSIASHGDAESVYGQTKWEVETRLLSLPNANTFSTVIAPGTIIGHGGVFAKTRSMVKRLPAVPVFYPFGGRRLQTVFIDDLCDAIITSITQRVTGRLVVADNKGVGLTDFYRGLAALDNRRPLLVPFPGDVALLGVKLLELAGLRLPVTSSNLKGIKHLHHFDVDQSNQLLAREPVGDYWQSLEKLATQENKPEVVESIRKLAARSA